MIRDVAELMSIDARTAEAETVLELADALPRGGRRSDPTRASAGQPDAQRLRGVAGIGPQASPADRQHGEATAAGHCRVAVRDNGVGIAAEAADRVFERFFSTKAGGMGMGLSVSQSIVESHGGTLSVAPVPEGGAVLRFTLPIHDGRAQPWRLIPTVFIVDDDPAVRQSLMALVRSMRLQAEAYESAQQFLDAFDASRPGACCWTCGCRASAA